MELKRVNVVIPEDAWDILVEKQTENSLPSKDKALAELLYEYKRLKDGKA